jgi:DNA gyrase subunit A
VDQKAQDRLHIIEGVLLALDNLPTVNEVVGRSADRAAAKAALRSELALSEVQVEHVLDPTIARQTKLGRDELRKEAEHLRSMA